MTSDTAPSGECFASSVFSSEYPAWKAFDDDSSAQGWGCGSGKGVGEYCGYKFTEATKVGKFRAIDSNGRTTAAKFEGSNDGITYTDISGSLTKTNGEFNYETNASVEYLYYRYYVVSVSQTNVGVNEIQFYSENICNNANAMQYIGNNNYASNTLLADSDWRTAICNSTYFESVLNVKVPTMTDITSPSGEIIYSSSVVYPVRFFNNSLSDFGVFNSATPSDNTIGYSFTKPMKIYCAEFIVEPATQWTFDLEAKNDGEAYVSLGSSVPNVRKILSGATAYKTYNIKMTYFGSYVALTGDYIQFYGREDV